MDGRALHQAIAEALEPSKPISDYYLHHPWRDDGGYLRSLVQACRADYRHLPSRPIIHDLAVDEARKAQVLALNHLRDPLAREWALKLWATQQRSETPYATSWWELSGAASAPLTIHALLALAAEPNCSQIDAARAHAAYSPWVSATTTMLDSYVDQPEDRKTQAHSYVAHYPTPQAAERDISRLVTRSIRETQSLRHGDRHTVIAAAMIAMYLSKDTARSTDLRAGTRTFAHAGGSLTQLLLPILRAWRIAYAQRTA
jgi:tetraprenyl-beta-curcumene synthase